MNDFGKGPTTRFKALSVTSLGMLTVFSDQGHSANTNTQVKIQDDGQALRFFGGDREMPFIAAVFVKAFFCAGHSLAA